MAFASTSSHERRDQLSSKNYALDFEKKEDHLLIEKVVYEKY